MKIVVKMLVTSGAFGLMLKKNIGNKIGTFYELSRFSNPKCVHQNAEHIHDNYTYVPNYAS
jgi:hypothetical protein